MGVKHHFIDRVGLVPPGHRILVEGDDDGGWGASCTCGWQGNRWRGVVDAPVAFASAAEEGRLHVIGEREDWEAARRPLDEEKVVGLLVEMLEQKFLSLEELELAADHARAHGGAGDRRELRVFVLKQLGKLRA